MEITSDDPVAAQSADDLWRAHSADLMRFATMLVGPSDAHDIVVDAFLRSVDVICAGGVDKPRPYLYRAVANAAIGEHRARRRRWSRELRAMASDVAAAGDPDVDVQRAVADLSVGQRAAIYLVYWEDLTERQAAATLGISLGTVRRHLVRARTHLRKALK